MSLNDTGIPRNSQSSQLAVSLVRSQNFLYHSSQFAVLFLASSQFLTNYKVKKAILLVICGQFRKKIVLFLLAGTKNWEIYFFEGEIQFFWSLSVEFHAERSQLAETERSEV